MSAIRIFSKFKELLDVSWGSIADGQVLKRNGANIVGTAMPQGPPGPAGAPGVAQVWKGEWNTSVVYQPNDAVSYNGSSFVATQSTIGVAPIPTVAPLMPPLATTASRGTIAALPSANQIQYYARGDNTWQILPQGTYTSGPASSVSGDLATYADTTGKLLGSISRINIIPAGNVVQAKFLEIASASTTATYPSGQIPQITQGKEIGSLSFTPLYANSLVRIMITGGLRTSVSHWMFAAVFRNVIASAVCQQQVYTPTNGGAGTISTEKYDTPATTSAITYTLRIAVGIAATLTIDAYTGPMVLTLQEIRQ